MASINICDWPGCGDALPKHGDSLRLAFSMHNTMENLRLREDRLPDDPRPLCADLCRRHSSYLRDKLELLFSGQDVVAVGGDVPALS